MIPNPQKTLDTTINSIQFLVDSIKRPYKLKAPFVQDFSMLGLYSPWYSVILLLCIYNFFCISLYFNILTRILFSSNISNSSSLIAAVNDSSANFERTIFDRDDNVPRPCWRFPSPSRRERERGSGKNLGIEDGKFVKLSDGDEIPLPSLPVPE